MEKRGKTNWRIVIYSLIAIACLVLMFKVDWLFIIPAVILMLLNQRELIKDRRKRNEKRRD